MIEHLSRWCNTTTVQDEQKEGSLMANITITSTSEAGCTTYTASSAEPFTAEGWYEDLNPGRPIPLGGQITSEGYSNEFLFTPRDLKHVRLTNGEQTITLPDDCEAQG
jgi:hypothetical protein